MLILAKNLSFLFPPWKLHNWYYHEWLSSYYDKRQVWRLKSWWNDPFRPDDDFLAATGCSMSKCRKVNQYLKSFQQISMRNITLYQFEPFEANLSKLIWFDQIWTEKSIWSNLSQFNLIWSHLYQIIQAGYKEG